jgi:hypothetical protein
VLWFAYVPQAIGVTYANAYGRFAGAIPAVPAKL